MQYRLSQIADILGAKRLGTINDQRLITQAVFDSRRVDFPFQSIFFAFSNSSNDGHDYISDAYNKGIRAFVVSKEINPDFQADASFLRVSDTLEALQHLARFHRQQFKLPVIGITGSNGKTIIKEWLFQLLHEDYEIVRSPRSYNSQIGVPLSVLQINEKHNLGIFEAGISKAGEMHKIAPVIDCSIGIFTNIGEAHNEGFESISQKIQEKLQLFKSCKTILYCKDHQDIDHELRQLTNKTLLSWSRNEHADLRIIKEEKTKDGLYSIQALYNDQTKQISIPFSDQASIENIIHCWLLLLHLGLEDQLISERLLKLNALPMRLELKAAINNCTLINDSYNSDLTSLAVALNFLKQQAGQLSPTVILSDIFQSGIEDIDLYQQVATLLDEHRIQKLVGIGQEVKILQQFSKVKVQHYFDSTEAYIISETWKESREEIILLKGARNFAFERIARHLAIKSHNTVLEVNLNALVHNLRVFREAIKPQTKLMAMVKAAAYGSGSDEVARLLEFQNIDYLAVAYADEGVELRKAGITLPIMVLNPEQATFDLLQQYNLEPEIYSQQLLDQLIRSFPIHQSLKIHLKIDTGMHRLGFEEEDLPQLTNTLLAQSSIRVASIFSHLAASDEPEQDTFTQNQITKLNIYYEKIATAIGYRPIKHILNTNGILRFPQHQYDMVRLGIGLYGIDSNKALSQPLETVLSLKASISQIKTIAAGETIGYSRKGVAEKETSIATISIGYADGLLRKAGNGRFSVLIHGKYAPTIGNICMDMSMIDISHIPEASEGDEVLIFGKDHPVEVLAECFDSLVYEVFTGISERVKRVYYQD